MVVQRGGVFASRAATERLPSAPRDLGPTTVSLPREGTDIEAGLRRGLADLPDGYVGRLVLLSDGNATHGDALAAAAAAAARGVTVDVLPIEREPGLDIAIESVRAPRVCLGTRRGVAAEPPVCHYRAG